MRPTVIAAIAILGGAEVIHQMIPVHSPAFAGLLTVVIMLGLPAALWLASHDEDK